MSERIERQHVNRGGKLASANKNAKSVKLSNNKFKRPSFLLLLLWSEGGLFGSGGVDEVFVFLAYFFAQCCSESILLSLPAHSESEQVVLDVEQGGIHDAFVVQELLLEVWVKEVNRSDRVGAESVQVGHDLLNTEGFGQIVGVALVGKHVCEEIVQPMDCERRVTVLHSNELSGKVLIRLIVKSSLVDKSLASFEWTIIRYFPDYRSNVANTGRRDGSWFWLWRLLGAVKLHFFLDRRLGGVRRARGALVFFLRLLGILSIFLGVCTLH